MTAVNRSSSSQEIQQAFTINAIVFFVIFVVINGLTGDKFKRDHENLIVVFATIRILLGFGIILPEKTRTITYRHQKRRTY